jgi:hypothetical protein
VVSFINVNRDACVRFMELWKRKHETGQWVEIEAAEAMSSRTDFSAMNASCIDLSNTINKQWPETPDSNRKAGVDPNAGMNLKCKKFPKKEELLYYHCHLNACLAI